MVSERRPGAEPRAGLGSVGAGCVRGARRDETLVIYLLARETRLKLRWMWTGKLRWRRVYIAWRTSEAGGLVRSEVEGSSETGGWRERRRAEGGAVRRRREMAGRLEEGSRRLRSGQEVEYRCVGQRAWRAALHSGRDAMRCEAMRRVWRE